MRVKRLSGVVMRLAVILLCLVLFSAHLASGMFARFTLSASYEDSARVAKADLKVIETQAMTVDTNGNGTYQFIIKNDSEVTFDCSVLMNVSYPNNAFSRTFGAERIASTLTNVSLNGDSGTVSDNKLSYKFEEIGAIPPQSESDVLVLTFHASDLAAGSRGVPILAAPTDTNDNKLPITLNVSALGEQIN